MYCIPSIVPTAGGLPVVAWLLLICMTKHVK